VASLAPDERAELTRWLEQQRKAIKKQRKSGVAPGLIEQIGNRYQWLEDRYYHQEALEVIELGFEGLRYVKQPAARQGLGYRVWRSKAVTSNWLGRYGESIEAYEKAVELGEKGAYAREKPQFLPGNRRELGSMYWRVGDLSEALRNLSIAEAKLEEAKAALREQDYLDELARLRAAFGLAYLDLGRYEDAAKSAAEAAHIHEKLGEEDPKRKLQAAIAYTTLGNARREAALEREADPEEALGAFDDAIENLKEAPVPEDREHADRLSDVYLGRGRTLFFQKKYETALEDLEHALRTASDMDVVQHAAVHYLYIGEAQAKLGRHNEAEASLKEAAERAERYGTPETRWRALYQLALLRETDGRTTEAIESLDECIATIEGLRSQYLPEPFKISMLAAKEGTYGAMVRILSRSQEGPEAEGARRVTEAFGYAERAKSRVFAEQLARTDLGNASGIPQELLEREHELVRELRILHAEHLEGLPAAAYDWGEELGKVGARLGKIRERMRRTARGEEYIALREATTLDYAGVRALLDVIGTTDGASEINSENGTSVGRVVLAAYFVLDEEVVAFVGRSDLDTPELHRVALPRKRLGDWAFAIENTDAEELESWDLHEWQRELGPLVEPLERWSDEDDVVWIVPHAELHLLPLHALKVGGRYLAERNPVVYSPSASVMPYCRARRTGNGRRALVVGDSLPAPKNLVHARAEAVAVAELLGVEPLLGERATKRELENKLRELEDDLRVLHVACHGEFDRADPLRSRIKLAPPLDGSPSGREPDLSAEEVLGLEVGAELVALSACASGVSGRWGGDELIGLTRSFLYAGAPSMVVGLWYVADGSTRVLMERFYGALLGRDSGEVAASSSKAQALRYAQRSVMGTEGFEHPYFWSPFVLVGDWR
jgi:tetratricopeptide (TPR) repeat protein